MMYEYTQKRYELREDSTADVIADYVRSILSLPRTRIEKIVVEAGSSDQPFPVVTTDMHVEKMEPPDGMVPETDPGNIWEALTRVEMVETLQTEPMLKSSSVDRVIVTMMTAAQSAHAPIGWVTGSGLHFLEWITTVKYSSHKVPSTFLGLPLVESQQVGDDRLIMLCGLSNRNALITAKWGYAIVMEGLDE